MSRKIKFGIGTVVDKCGYKGVVTDVRNKQQREVKLSSGKSVTDVHDLKYWKKKK